MKKRVGQILNIVVLICISMIFLVAIVIGIFGNNTFKYKTYINGIECSFLNLEKAEKKLEKEMNKTKITLIFTDNKQYTCLGAYFEIKIQNEEELKKTLNNQNESDLENNTYELNNLYSVNEDKIKKYLQGLSVFKKENMHKSQNAYLKIGKNKLLHIKPEKYGNFIELDKACDFMIESLKNGITIIDFREIMDITPKILSTDKNLIAQKDYINSILSTTIKYKLYDGSTYNLDADIMKDWIYQDDEGNYNINIEKNIPQFVKKLNEKASYELTSTNFRATGVGKIPISFGRKTYSSINEEKEEERIKEQLNKNKSTTFEPIYNPLPDYSNISSYLEIDLSRQNVWLYINGKCIVDTPCVTGSVSSGYATPAGIYYLTYKTTNTYLEGYNGDGSEYSSFVNYWMPFNGGIGLHDATWRSNFGGNINMTNGSHGCVNLPYSAAKEIYQNIDTSIPIIVYYS